MNFAEKIKELRKAQKLTQQEVADACNITKRTLQNYEAGSSYPKQREIYSRLAKVLNCEQSYLMTEEEAFITEASELYGRRGAKQAERILEQTAAMFAGGELSDADQIAFLNEIQSLYLDSKIRAKKFTPKKYRTGGDTNQA